MIRMRLFALLGGAVLAAAGGCANQGKDESKSAAGNVEPPRGLIAQARPPIQDVPVPIGFSLEESRSRSFYGGGVRWVDHTYKGNEDKFDVMRFFQKHMPANRWKPMSNRFVQGRIKLEFEKEVPGYTEGCAVTIWDDGVFSPTRFTVECFPRGEPGTVFGSREKG
jgi:hypothetical protein